MAIKTLNEFRDEVGAWTDEQFPGQPAINPLIGADEERGKSIARYTVKTEQGIRGDELNDEYMQAELGDICIYHADFCYRVPIDMCYYPKWSPISIDNRIDAWRESLYYYTNLVTSHAREAPTDIESAGAKYLSTINAICNFFGYDMVDCMETRFVEVSNREWDSIYKQREGGD